LRELKRSTTSGDGMWFSPNVVIIRRNSGVRYLPEISTLA